MNWLVFIPAAYLLLATQSGLAPAWQVGDVAPNLLLVLAVFVGLRATPGVTAAAFLTVGVLLDLQPGPLGAEGVIVGPHALGYLLGAYAAVNIRHLLFRESLLTLAVMVGIVGGFAALIEVTVYTLRGLPWLTGEPVAWSPLAQLGRRGQTILYTAGIALPLGFALNKSKKIWGFR